ncbi:hypothetical protein ES705_36870 [subsurface metagenome]
MPEYYESPDAARPKNLLFHGDFNTDVFVWENIITLKKTFAEKHAVTLLGGYTRQSDVYRYFGRTGSNVPYNTDLWFISNSAPDDPTDNDFQDISSDIGGITINNWVPYDATLVSYLGRLIYSYDGRYDLTASVRRDGSSRFSEQNKWGVFPAFESCNFIAFVRTIWLSMIV